MSRNSIDKYNFKKLGHKFFTLIRCSKERPDLVCLLGFTTVWLHEFLKTEVNTGHNVGRLFPFSAKVGLKTELIIFIPNILLQNA